jgi:hypothetical protein
MSKAAEFSTMTSEKQIAANRANARHGTGPKTMAGRLKSSCNAYRHGLSYQLQLDPVAMAKANTIAQALVGDQAGEGSFDCERAIRNDRVGQLIPSDCQNSERSHSTTQRYLSKSQVKKPCR